MYTLGIKPSLGNRPTLVGGGRAEAGACLLDDGEVIAAAEEERFSRDKHALDQFPARSIEYVLSAAEITLSDVAVVGIGRDRRKRHALLRQEPTRLLPTSLGEAFDVVRELASLVAVERGAHVDTITSRIDAAAPGTFRGQYETIPHHRCHAASAAYCAPTDPPVTITIDGRGEHDSTVVWNRELDRVETFPLSNSIGRFYATGVRYLGYHGDWGAGKVMGLAAYGTHRDEFEEAFSDLVEYGDGSYDVTALLGVADPVALLEDRFGPRRERSATFTDRHRDFAHHLQVTTEWIVTGLVRHYLSVLDATELAFAGGVAMNCRLNRRIADLDAVDSLFVQPVANDAGICLGAALEAHQRATGLRPDPPLEHLSYGPAYDAEAIEATLAAAKVPYERVDDICARTADLLADGDLVGWFQGRMEFGPRALGNRSILADPRSVSARDAVNANVKDREAWRPFAPSIRHERREEYLENAESMPFMIRLDTVPANRRDEIAAVVHTDGTTRPQTVRREANERYHRLLGEFEARTGVPVVLNTSFNVSGEPIVGSPAQALRDFYASGLDALAIGDFLLSKPATSGCTRRRGPSEHPTTMT